MNRRIIWGGLLLLTFLVFYSWMPADVYLASKFFIGLVGGVLCGIFLVQLIADFKDMDEARAWNKGQLKDWYYKLLFAVLPVTIGLIITFAMHYDTLGDNELKEFGVRVQGTVLDGYYKKSSKTSEYALTVGFYNKKGKYIRQQTEVSSSQYDKAGKGQHVEVIYSSKHPSLIKILLSDDVIEEFTGVKSRSIKLDDITKLLDLSRDSILPALNKISYRWTKAEDSTSYVNDNRQLYLTADPHFRITYVATGHEYSDLLLTLADSGFKQDTTRTKTEGETENKMEVFTKNDLKLILQYKTIERESSNDMSAIQAAINGENRALVVTMFKN